MDFRLLGPVEVDDESTPCRIPEGGVRTLLAALLVHANTTVSSDSIASYVWESQPPRQPREALQVMVARLRKSLGPRVGARIAHVRPGYRITVRPGELDLDRFADLRRRGSAAHGSEDWQLASDLLGQALECWRGQPLEDVSGGSLALEAVPALHEQRLDALYGRIGADLALGRHGHLVSELTRLVEDEPLRERFRCQLMLALYRSGGRAKALDVYHSGRRALVEELGIDPGMELQELYQAMLCDDPALAWSVPRSPASTADAPLPPGWGLVRPAQLSADLSDFTGRTRLVSQLEVLLARTTADRAGGPVVLSAIDGAGGMGKTSLAVHVAHRMLDQYPDGQLQADLHGAGGSPAEPGDVLARFLRGLGLPPENIPGNLEERGALYRSTVAGQRILVLLDNVKDAAQVRPLLPGSGTCAVLVTSRSALPGLDGACRVTVDVLSEDEALELFTRVVGTDAVTAEPEAVAAVLKVCAGLPLAIRIAASRLARQPGWTVQSLAGQLRDESQLLDELQLEDRAVRSSFAVGVNGLAPQDARAFGLLGLWNGPDITPPAAAALLDLSPRSAQHTLDTLSRVHLIDATQPHRYAFHDLLRVYAAERTRMTQSPVERDAATHRVLTWYLHTSAAASRVLSPSRRHVALDPPEPACRALDFAGYDDALAWCETERANLVAAVAQAARTGRHEIGWKLPITMWDLFYLRRQPESQIDCYEMALASVRELSDPEATAWVLNSLASAYQVAGRLAEAADCLRQALDIRSRVADVRGEASCLINLGYVHVEMGRAGEAVDMLERALGIFRRIGLRAGEAAAQANLGEAHKHLGNLATALDHYREGLTMVREVSDQFTIGRFVTNIAETLYLLGHLDEAAEHAAQGHVTNREAGNRIDEAIALDVLGQVHAAKGQRPLAMQHWRQAHAILTDLGNPRAAEVSARLSSY